MLQVHLRQTPLREVLLLERFRCLAFKVSSTSDHLKAPFTFNDTDQHAISVSQIGFSLGHNTVRLLDPCHVTLSVNPMKSE